MKAGRPTVAAAARALQAGGLGAVAGFGLLARPGRHGRIGMGAVLSVGNQSYRFGGPLPGSGALINQPNTDWSSRWNCGLPVTL